VFLSFSRSIILPQRLSSCIFNYHIVSNCSGKGKIRQNILANHFHFRKSEVFWRFVILFIPNWSTLILLTLISSLIISEYKREHEFFKLMITRMDKSNQFAWNSKSIIHWSLETDFSFFNGVYSCRSHSV